LWGVGIHGEGGYAFVKPVGSTGSLERAARDHERLLIGIDYTFKFQLYLIAEYMRLGQGIRLGDSVGLNERMAYLSGEVLTANRDTLFLGGSYPITSLIDLGLYTIIGCNDPSAVINPRVDVDLYKALDLAVSGFIPVGSENSQNGHAGPGFFVRLRYSF